MIDGLLNRTQVANCLTSKWLLRRVNSSSDRPYIYTMSNCQTQKLPLEALLSCPQSLCEWSLPIGPINIDPDCRVRARCYPMRMKPFFQYSLSICCSSTNLEKNMLIFLLCAVAEKICMEIYIVCFQVGQMLFADNKYLLL